MRRQRRYVAADALDRLADCRCAGCGQVDTSAIREDWWRRHADDGLGTDAVDCQSAAVGDVGPGRTGGVSQVV